MWRRRERRIGGERREKGRERAERERKREGTEPQSDHRNLEIEQTKR